MIGAVETIGSAERSIESAELENVLLTTGSKGILVDWDLSIQYVEQKSASNRIPFELPDDMMFDVDVDWREEFGMPVLFLNKKSSSGTVVFYFHGGAYISHPTAGHLAFCARLARELDMAVVMPLYPKLTDNDVDVAYRDVLNLYHAHAHEAKRVVFMGDSSGGGLALGLAQLLRDTSDRGVDDLILISPWLDVSMENEEMVEYEDVDPMLGIAGLRRVGILWAGENSVKDPRVSPIYGDMSSLGNVTLFSGTREIFYPEIIRLANILEEQGVSYSFFTGVGQNHCFVLFDHLPEAKEAWCKIKEALS